jgi:hypothetical protein
MDRVGLLARVMGRVVTWRWFRAGAPGSWWRRAWGWAAFILAYFDGNSYINRYSVAVWFGLGLWFVVYACII